MSASKQKKVRSDLRAGGGKKSAEQLEAEKKSRRFRRNTVIAVATIVVVLAAALFINSDYLYNRASAVTVGSTSYSAAEFDYFYRNAYSSFTSNYGNYASIVGLDTSMPLDQQQSGFSEDENGTWADYFTETAEESMQQITALYDEAAAGGYALSEEGNTEVRSNVNLVASNASLYGYDTDAYLALTYGKGMTEEIFRNMTTRHVTANEYGQSISDSYTYTAQELADYYATVADTYDTFKYYSYYFSASDEAYAELDEEERAGAAQADAESVAEAATVEEFVKKINELTDGEETEESLLTSRAGSGVSGNMRDWLLDPSRKEGDITSVAEDNGAYALLFVSRGKNDYNTVNVRHILIEAVADENGEYTDEALDAARERAEELLAQWEENATEENFASLADQYSEDSGSNTNGGLYENVAKGDMVEEFDAFCFDEGHKAGDTGIVYGSNGSYAGYHVVYYVGEGPVYADYIAENALRSADYNEYLEEITAGYEIAEKFALRFAKRS